jgi:hypothetical protein
MPPGGKLPAMRAFVGAIVESNEARDQDRLLGAKIALDAALKLSERLGAVSSSLLDLLAALNDRDHGRLPEWIKPTTGGSHPIWDERYPRALAVAVVERLKAAGVPYEEGYAKVAKAYGLGSGRDAATKVKKWRERRETFFRANEFAMLLEYFQQMSPQAALAELRREIERPF